MNGPLKILQKRAEEKLQATTRSLGGAQQTLQQAVSQQRRLQGYEQEYQQSLRAGMQARGLRVADLVNHQSFITSLNQVVSQQGQQVAECQQAVARAREAWLQDQRRLTAFNLLLSRRDSARLLAENRREQKVSDEFAQRAVHHGGRV